MNANTHNIASDDPLAVLAVIDRLEVGPAKVEPSRLTTPLRVTVGERVESCELVYKYEMPVFESLDSGTANLAALMGAQIALNYGLFCREMVFHGPLDAADRRFLLDMARNTAREIYVNKFLHPNPFLTGAAQQLPVVRRRDYLRATLIFPDSVPEGLPTWQTDAEKVVILSSGGKDSLLSFGLMRELGLETHPVFVNESGRHWYTALNAYRHFRAHVPNTARVWTNCDRVYTWMLGFLPFVRKDFATIRADMYPIRLWTVAVFLFGVLPIVRQRGLGLLLVGDEFDTTVRVKHEGITHYDGLYDQSRFFDTAMTRYFMGKGWQVGQTSILRPLSELLIQKTLAERYPDLLHHQVSCHAAHIDGERVLPCGKCEKCRRIVGMMLAIGGEPARCGYHANQVPTALAQLVERGVHQERDGARYLGWLLQRKGLLRGDRIGDIKIADCPRIIGLRFDQDKSPLEVIPLRFRKGWFRIVSEHAQGCFLREGRRWQPCEMAQLPGFMQPAVWESRGAAKDKHSPQSARALPQILPVAPDEADHVLWASMTWPEAEERLRHVDIALLPVGAIEQHGPHLPLDVDAWDADYLAKQVAAACAEPRPLVLPLIPYGVSYHHEDFAGTITISHDALAQMVYDVGMSLAKQGITKLVIINGHGGNVATLQYAAQKINRDAHIFTCVDTGETSDTDIAALAETVHDVHAGEIETSTSMVTRPHLVQMDRAERWVPTFGTPYLDFDYEKSVEWYVRTAKISSSGTLGDPAKASREKGVAFWQIMIQNLVEFVEHLKNTPLDTIYHRRHH